MKLRIAVFTLTMAAALYAATRPDGLPRPGVTDGVPRPGITSPTHFPIFLADGTDPMPIRKH